MSDKNMARRALVQISAQGADITKDIRPYLDSLTYIDNEEDESDDLQIKLHDREGIWLTKWIPAMVDAAASAGAGEAAGGGGTTSYKVTPKIGLNVRSGPGTSYSRYGALVCGTVIQVKSIENGWASIDYNGKSAYVSASYITQTGESSEAAPAAASKTGFKLQAVIIRQNWNGDGSDKVLDCGQFELDTVAASGPPSSLTFKAAALPFSSQIRQTKKSKAWEAYNLSGIANEMAAANGMTCMFLSVSDPYYERVEQRNESDISFLSVLCHGAGISLKVTNNLLILFDQADYESKPAAFTIRKGGNSYTKYRLNIGTAEAQYSSCRVSYVQPSGACIAAVAKVEDYKEDAKNNQQLEITAKVSSVGEAKTLAEKYLRLHNKYAKTATFTMPGNPDIVAGVTMTLEGWGAWDGKYIVKQAKHTVSGSGYTVQVTLRRVLEGY